MTFNIPGLEMGKIASRMRDNIGGGDWEIKSTKTSITICSIDTGWPRVIFTEDTEHETGCGLMMSYKYPRQKPVDVEVTPLTFGLMNNDGEYGPSYLAEYLAPRAVNLILNLYRQKR